MTLIERVVAILLSPYVKNLKPFSFGGVSYIPASDLSVVCQAILWGSPIGVKTKNGLVGARYLMGKDLMLLPPSITSVEAQGMVVHETVHAWQDVLRLGGMPAPDAEGAAYIVQMMFLFQQLPAGKRLIASSPDLDWVFEVAWDLASVIMGGNTPSSSAYSVLDVAIGQVPQYSGIIQRYHGVPSPWPNR